MNKKAMAALGILSTVSMTPNAYAENIVYGEDIPVGKESEYVFKENETILEAYKDLTKEEANSLKIELEKTGYTTVVLNNYLVKTGVIKNSIEIKFINLEKAMEYVEKLKLEGITVENISFIHDTDKVEGLLEETFNNFEEAESALKDFESEYNEDTEGSITENKTEQVIDTIIGNTAYETFEEAKNALDEFLNDESNETKEFYFTGEIIGPKGTGEYTTSKIEVKFENKEKAESYLKELENEGFIILDYEFTNDTKKIDNSLEETFNTLEEAEKALEDFKNEYNEDTEGSIKKVYNESKNQIENFDKTFNTLEEANNYLDDKNSLANEDTVIDATLTKNESNDEKVNIEEVYQTLESAEIALDNIKNSYDIVEDDKIETISAGTVYEAVTITQDMKVYEVGATTYILIKKGNDYYVWTEKELTKDEIAKFKETYSKIATDNVITGDRINSNKAKFIYGMNVYTSSNKKLFSFVEEDGKLYIIMDSGAESRVVYGHFIPVTEYHLKATAYNKIYSWNVKGNVTTKGYDYNLKVKGSKIVTLDSGLLTGNKKIENQGYYYNLDKKAKTYTVKAKGSKTITLDSGLLTGNKKIENQGYYYNLEKKAKTYTVKAKGSKTVTLENGTLTADTLTDKMEEFYSLDLTKSKYNLTIKEEVNPKTGDNALWTFTFCGFSMIGIAATTCYWKKEDE